ncbi:DEAD/DEAH box helicase family protein [Azohydromonas sediminis]|uniref:DEAD/DEAH box helicase family protein n=1 Tax=Azohydromonas sediminis TaxID=2259674 RepID=UPI000E65D954|nr:DEAD/DEAH box helicase family protein [Azohydromonas sediminis]
MTQLINPHDFVREMEHHWTNRLGNVASDALRQAWLQIGHHFGRNILAHGNPIEGPQWNVLQPATGSGKSQGTAVYCAMLARFKTTEEHPGVLIVVRQIVDADQMAQTINALAGREDYAKAYHSEANGPGVLDSLSQFPVLVITHRAYEMALDALGHDGTIRQTWPLFHGWGFGERKLVVIDEALDIVEESSIDLEGLRLTLAAIPEKLRNEHKEAVDAVKAGLDILERMAQVATSAGDRTAEAILLQKAIDEGTPPDLTELRRAMREVRFDLQVGKSDKDLLASLRERHDTRLKDLNNLFRGWVYYAKAHRRGHTLNTARLLVPEEVKGAVVLDATASANLVYQLFDKAEVIVPPQGVRNYRNVTVHVSKGHRVGKEAMKREGDKLMAAVFDDLNQRIPGRSALVVTHKDTEAKAMTYETTFDTMHGHWGAVTGSNTWRDCDVAVILGLPYLPDTWTANTFMALQGVQSTEWLRNDERPFGNHTDVRKALKLGQMTSDLVQAINRIRCRRVINEDGDCPPVDVFLLLPPGDDANTVLEGLTSLMPGIRVVPWELHAAPKAAKRGRKADMSEAAVRLLENALPGKYPKSYFAEELGMSTKYWEKFVRTYKDESSEVRRRLTDLRISYRTEGAGRGARSYFCKE